jgi:adenylosuccinate lyase
MDWSQRYSTPLEAVFGRKHKLELEWQVELALLKALGEEGIAPKEAYEEAKAVIECACDAGRTQK